MLTVLPFPKFNKFQSKKHKKGNKMAGDSVEKKRELPKNYHILAEISMLKPRKKKCNNVAQ